MPRVWLGSFQLSKIFHHAPDFGGITAKRLNRGVLFWIVPIPQPAGITKRGNPTFSGNARPCQRDGFTRPADCLRGAFNEVLHISLPIYHTENDAPLAKKPPGCRE